MKIKLHLIFALVCLNLTLAQTTAGSDWSVSKVQLTTRLAYPFEITYGPDGLLWITERRVDLVGNEGERVIRVNPTNGNKEELIDLHNNVYYDGGQDGLLGMAIHPDLYANINTTTNNYVFVAYTYDEDPGLAVVSKLRIARLIYNNSTGKLTPDNSMNSTGAILEGLPASTDHQAGRLKIGPDLKLYYTIGDQGANQFKYYCNPNLAQVLPSSSSDYDHYVGKILRLNLDGTIPADNPTLNNVQSHVYTYGHRNPQGLIFAVDGTLYNSEQMDKVDDELNKIVAGGNYGWPEIAGYFDDKGYKYCNWSSSNNCSSENFTSNTCGTGAIYNTEFQSYPSGAPANFQPPIGTIGSTIDNEPTGSYTTWPTKAPSSLDIYEAGLIPGWGKSLFITSLKAATIYRAELSVSGDDIVGDTYEVFHTTTGGLTPPTNNDRFRDTAFDPSAPGGFLMYAITDTNSQTNKGQIIRIEYTGPTASTSDVLFANFQIYPNPSEAGFFKLRIPNEIYDFNMSISTMLGQKLYTKKIINNKTEHIIDVSNLKTGIYLMIFETKFGKYTKKVTIQ